MTHSIRYVFIALLFGYFLIAQAEAQQQKMYSWTDENGVVHFSDVQPEGQQAQEQQGETERMDDVERTDRVAELKSQIAQNCK